MTGQPITTSSCIRIVVADSNRMQAQLLTNALRRRSDFHVTACSSDVVSVLKAVDSRPAVMILALSHWSDVAEQMATLRVVHLAQPLVAKVLLVESYDRQLVVSAFRSGVRGIFSVSDTYFRLLCRCIQCVADGQVWANTEQMNFLLDLVSAVPSLRILNDRGRDLLTPREEQVVALVVEGLANRDIARELGLSEHTVKKYVVRIFDKLGVSSRVELALYAVHHSDPLQAEWLTGAVQAEIKKTLADSPTED